MKIEKEKRNREILLNAVADYTGIPMQSLSISGRNDGHYYVYNYHSHTVNFKGLIVVYIFHPRQEILILSKRCAPYEYDFPEVIRCD